MRIPLSKVYRAFPELDRFSDLECEMYVRHVSSHSGFRIAFAAFMTTMGVMFGLPLLLCTFGRLFNGLPRSLNGVFMIAAVGGLFTGPLWGFLCRDLLLRRAIRERLRVAVCPSCSYSLVGLRVVSGRVKCPECGDDVELARHDLTEHDLVAERD